MRLAGLVRSESAARLKTEASLKALEVKFASVCNELGAALCDPQPQGSVASGRRDSVSDCILSPGMPGFGFGVIHTGTCTMIRHDDVVTTLTARRVSVIVAVVIL